MRGEVRIDYRLERERVRQRYRRRREREEWQQRRLLWRSQRSPGAAEIRRMAEKATSNPIERHLVGDRGHWIEHHSTAGDGREQWKLFSPEGELLGYAWGKQKAEAAIHELIETGSITR